jgi:hypothetical protein
MIGLVGGVGGNLASFIQGHLLGSRPWTRAWFSQMMNKFYFYKKGKERKQDASQPRNIKKL